MERSAIGIQPKTIIGHKAHGKSKKKLKSASSLAED